MKKILVSVMLVSMLGACSTPSDNKMLDKSLNEVGEAGAHDANSAKMLDDSSKHPLTDPNSILSQRSVYFDFDSFVVKSEYHDTLSAHAKYLSANQQANIIIQGNTDNRGTAEYNLALGQKRAEAVKKTLNILGVLDSKIETVSFGKERPKEMGSTENAQAKNRRADIVYLGEEQ